MANMNHYDYDVMIMYWFFYNVFLTTSYVIGKWLIIWIVICNILIIWFTLQTYTIWLTATIAKWWRNDFSVSLAWPYDYVMREWVKIRDRIAIKRADWNCNREIDSKFAKQIVDSSRIHANDCWCIVNYRYR